MIDTAAAVIVEKTACKGWPNCYRIRNAEVELVVTTDVGPRVIHYGFLGGRNIFKEFDDQLGNSGESTWMPRGGHRIWFAPEDPKLTYAADNVPVNIRILTGSVELTAPVEPDSGFEKQMVISLSPETSAVTIVHRIKNTRPDAVEIAPWVLTLMAPGGVGITGFPPRGTHPEILLPTNPLVMWAFTDFSDKRWQFTKKYLMLHNDPGNSAPTKAGLFNPVTWGAYLLGTDLFIKRYTADSTKRYPDFQCSYETFTNAEVLELETLGPLERIQQGESVEHIEHWSLHQNIEIPSFTDANLDKIVLPLL
jgi:hypothetical protein